MSTYSSVSLGTANEHPHPVVADGFGRWPQVFFDDTDPDPDDPDVSGRQYYRVRVTDADGVLIYDDDSVPIIGTVTGEGGGGGGVPIDQNALARTGDVKIKFGSDVTADTGWVRCNGETIGDEGSGAIYGAANAQALFVYLHPNPTLLLAGGATKTTPLGDFNAGRQLILPDMRHRALFGVGIMGNGTTNVARIADAYIDTPTTSDKANVVGAVGGDDDIALTTAEMPAHSHDATGVPAWAGPTPPATALKAAFKAPNHNHPIRISPTSSGDPDGGTGGVMTHVEASFTRPAWVGPPGTGTADDTHQIGSSGDIAITGNTGLAGGTGLVPAGNASAHENMPPFMLVTYLIKL
jgi:microcystin-dependent protein